MSPVRSASSCSAGQRVFARSAGGHGRNEAVLFERQVGNEIVQLEHEPHFMAQRYCVRRRLSQFRAVDKHAPARGLIQPAEQVEQVLLPQPEGPQSATVCAGKRFEVDAVQHLDRPVFVALPHIFGAQ